jgi:hypothetical protein
MGLPAMGSTQKYGIQKTHFYRTLSHILMQGNTILGLLDHALVPAQ